MDMNINSGFSPEKGFFRDADGGGSGSGNEDGDDRKQATTEEGNRGSEENHENQENQGNQESKEHQENQEEQLGASVDGGEIVDDETTTNENSEEKAESSGAEQKSNFIKCIRKNLEEIDTILTDTEEENFVRVYDLIESSAQIIRDQKDHATPRELMAFKYLGSELEKKAQTLGYQIETKNYKDADVQDVTQLDEKEKQELLEDINYTWDITLNTTYRHLQISQEPELMEHVKKIKAGIEKLYGKNSSLIKLLDLSINIRDLANSNAGEQKHLCINNVENFLNLLKSSKLTKEDVDDFKKTILFVPENDPEHPVTVRTVFDFICDDLLFVKNQRGYKWKDTDGNEKYYNFAKEGDREGVIKNIIKERYPFLDKLPSFVLDSIIDQVIIQGARYDAFAPYYTYYQASPIFGMDAEWYSATNPLITILYSIASSPPIPGGKTLLQVVRLPEASHYRDKEGNQLPTIDLSPNKGLDPESPAYAEAYSKLKRFTKYSEAMEERYYGEDASDLSKREEAIIRKRKTVNAWITLINVRNSLCEIVSPDFDIGYVTINPDFKFLPSLHDVYEGVWKRQNPKTKLWKPNDNLLKDLSVQDYIEIQQRFGEFLDLVDKSPNLQDRIDLGSEMKKAFSATSKFKAIFTSLNINKDTPEDHPFYDFLQIVRLMYVVYIKKLFNKYIELPPIPGWANFQRADKEFLSVIRNSLEQETGTIPEAIAGYLLNKVIIPAQNGKPPYSSVFNITAKTEPWIASQIKKGTNYAKLFERWVKEPTAAEKDPNKE